MTDPAPLTVRWCVLGRGVDGRVTAVDIQADGSRGAMQTVSFAELSEYVAERERNAAPRWVWSDTPTWYPTLLEAGVRVARCTDLRLSHAILRNAASVQRADELRAAEEWDVAAAVPDPEPRGLALFELERTSTLSVPHGIEKALAEFARQREALATAAEPARLGFLLAAESAGALAAVEMSTAGVPWDIAEHDRLLREALGARPASGMKPQRMVEVAEEVRAALGDPQASLDSPPKLLRALKNAGIEVSSTSQWELAEHSHPALEPLLRYKKLARLFTANGWTWMDEWVRDGRYRPVYVPGGVVTGRWASSGGGALQLPRQLRPVLRADPGWLFVSADVAQLEPRVLAAMSTDHAMAEAGRGKDLYAGVVASGAVATRDEAKIAVLGAMYGATTGDSGRLVPRLRRSFPRAMRLVDESAETGEHGGTVSTWLGRTSPPPGAEWAEVQAVANGVNATSRDEDRARRVARDFGRFTRNFVVQGTAAEWALAWIADLRTRLMDLGEATDTRPATASGVMFERRPHLVFFLHDEIIVHTPAELAEKVAEVVAETAVTAGRRMFGSVPVDFPLDLRISERAEKG
ncbi:bifunctional 3'-5' exonuclease/DNA polymerase [Leucobacter viscericola]|uniref:DNA-directed DNA polymerase n=1 Tax=Leucobacter viscericola TaxID=2714935 RepID=A0A6G7XI45_9MICO|nr:bifunctional 3'-5' exonuclease/DNA polymerase [Leucobacter viscericola]QIK64038.1 bifunctional 3'-5' exonuclease/DNA polymerase [Leucobacter viscericola]